MSAVSALAQHCLALAEREERMEQASEDFVAVGMVSGMCTLQQETADFIRVNFSYQ